MLSSARLAQGVVDLRMRIFARVNGDEGVLDELDSQPLQVVRLRDRMMPIWAEIYYELVFGEQCPREARSLIVANANDVVTALKCCGLRHMRKRRRLTDYLRTRLEDTIHPLPDLFSPEEQAWYLQGAFFNTAIVQMSEAMTHVLLAVAQHPDVQKRLVTEPDDDYADRVIDESLRCWPLFGIAHRVTTRGIEVDTTTLPAGTVLCFSYPDYHAHGCDAQEQFDPDRWTRSSVREINHIPFGVTANRPCPARGVAPLTMRVVLRAVLQRFELDSTAAHTRSIPNRGPCLLRQRGKDVRQRHKEKLLARMAARDRREDVTRSLVQLVLGTYMVLDARRKRMAQRYFDEPDVSERS